MGVQQPKTADWEYPAILGDLGGHEWNRAAYSPQLSAFFVPATDWCNQIRQAENAPDPDPHG